MRIASGTRLASLALAASVAAGACASLNRSPQLGVATAVIRNPLDVPVEIYQVFRDGSRINDAREGSLGIVAARDSAMFPIVAGGRGWYDFVILADSVHTRPWRYAGVSRAYHAENGDTIRWIVSLPSGQSALNKSFFDPRNCLPLVNGAACR